MVSKRNVTLNGVGIPDNENRRRWPASRNCGKKLLISYAFNLSWTLQLTQSISAKDNTKKNCQKCGSNTSEKKND